MLAHNTGTTLSQEEWRQKGTGTIVVEDTNGRSGDRRSLLQTRPLLSSILFLLLGVSAFALLSLAKDQLWLARNRLALVVQSMEEEQLLLGLAGLGLSPTDLEIRRAETRSLVEAVSPIYCHGPLLAAMQTARLFPDCKEFTDMPLRESPEKVLSMFQSLSGEAQSGVDIIALKAFVDKFFAPAGSDVKNVVPPDFSPNAPYLAQVEADWRPLASATHNLWPSLSLQCAPKDTKLHSSSLLPRRNIFVVPGGRFREGYYWDSAWTIKGLLVSGMFSTAKGIVADLLADVACLGFVPNGSRVYYAHRSQPPLLAEIVYDLCKYVGEDSEEAHEIRHAALPFLRQELDFWVGHRSITLDGHSLALYGPRDLDHDDMHPRPESFREDVAVIEEEGTGPGLYADLAAAAESGWDFSSRWGGGEWNGLGDTKTRSIIPVDLNAILYRAEAIVSAMCQAEGDLEGEVREQIIPPSVAIFTCPLVCSQIFHRDAAARRKLAVNSLMWDRQLDCWQDIVLSDGSMGDLASTKWKKSGLVTAACFIPLWAGFYSMNALDGLIRSGLIQEGGIMTSLNQESGQQWDGANAWAPLQWMVVEGLLNLDRPEAFELAMKIVDKWLANVLRTWKATGSMHE